MNFIFNILASSPRNFEMDALAEFDFIIHSIFPCVRFNYGKTIVKGLVWGNVVDNDPVFVVSSIRKFVEDNRFQLQFLLKFVPIQDVMYTDLDIIEKYIINRLHEIDINESFKIVIRKRRVQLNSLEIIEHIAKNIDRKVELENPDKIIRLEIIGKYTGVSILKPGDVFCPNKIDRRGG
ncbi:MAG: THUMP domain-containing protein [Promethearchaeota archaeon]